MKNPAPPLARFSLILLLSCVSFQTLQAESELDKLRTSFDAAMERATAPVRHSYEAELRKLLDRQTKAGQLDGAIVVRAELEKLTGRPEGKPAGEVVAVSGAKAMEPLFVDKTWQTPTGTKFTFAKDGTCERQFNATKATIKWRTAGPKTIEVYTRTPSEARYFRFVSEIEAYYGNSKTETNTLLKPVPRK